MHKKCDRCKQWKKDYGKDVSCDACPDGTYKNTFNFIGIGTVSFKQNKNVSVKRIEMIKKRVLHPDSKTGDVVLRNHAGKLTNRLASDY